DDVVNGERGTGAPVKSKFFNIAGKTGTAQIRGAGGHIAGHQVSFCGFFPVDNPQYTCIVVIQKPRVGAPSGGGMAGVVLKQIAEGMYARNFMAMSDILPVDSLRPHEPVIKPDVKHLQVENGLVPNVKGMGARDATYALESSGLRVKLQGRGAVKSQSIRAGHKISRGETITLYLE
ncbi:PASTA domain-containing protein, partial [Bacteroidales bacterium OttesenSCG-928-L03]|nr:PASTA domain-containing protein [Bacteroidales bacterium OttesenSCG-928-L03]